MDVPVDTGALQRAIFFSTDEMQRHPSVGQFRDTSPQDLHRMQLMHNPFANGLNERKLGKKKKDINTDNTPP